MAKQWDNHVNKNFYGEDSGYKNNKEETEYKSGRSISFLKNSVPKKTHAVNLRCSDRESDKTDGKTEFEHFLNWFENTIKSGTLSFLLPDVVTGKGEKEYKLGEAPTWSGQAFKEINLKLEEV